METFYKTDEAAKFLIMCDIERRAKELVAEAIDKKGEFGGYTFCAGIVGYRYPKKLWKEAKSAGFEKEADGRWVGFTTSFNGEESVAEEAYLKALNEKKAEIGAASFLDNVTLYYYLT